MFRKLFLIGAVAALAAGCGTQKNASHGGDEAPAGGALTAQNDAGTTTGTTEAGGGASAAEAGSTVAMPSQNAAPAVDDPSGQGSEPALRAAPSPEASETDRDMARAEQMKSAGTSTPAVDTSQLRIAPAWQLTTLDGAPMSNADFTGKVVILDFWATWCPPCRRGIPDLKDLYARYQDNGLQVVGISLDQKGPAVVKPFAQQVQINYPVVMGNAQIAQAFGGVSAIPTSFVITQDGRIYKAYVGLQPKETLENDVRTLLGLS